ncbi:MAG TPA: FHA domain-containing protein [Bryobacteraceae bacterium]|nr:FHA domain-containing protein [Bryobacteraceae bacterium]
MSWLDDLEKTLSRRVTGLAKDVSGAPREKSLIEICKEIQEQLRDKIVAQDRGLRAFPYSRVEVRIFAKSEEQRAAYDAVLNGPEPLSSRLRAMLVEEECRVGSLTIDVAIAAIPQSPVPFEVRCARASRPPHKRPKAQLAAKLTVLRGDAESSELRIVTGRVNIGRLREVVSAIGEVIRINDLAFRESETTIAREHAFIRWDSTAGHYLLFDALSGGRGTRLFRGGESIRLPRGPSKGTALEHGDEIHLGTARIRFELC